MCIPLLRTVTALAILAAVSAACDMSPRRTAVVSPDECPLPAGVAEPPPLPVTAQEVENGTASLMDFVAAAVPEVQTSGPGALTPKQAAHNGCLFRKEGSSYRSGSTYLVILTLDGRVLIHAKDMALSGRLLNPVVYRAILQAVGIEQAALADPATAPAAIGAAVAGDGGAFDVAGIPGASGYAAVYFSYNFGILSPNVLLGGFELDGTHVVEEDLDYGDPAITAAEVVDRATLKQFVTEAGNYFTEFITSGDLTALSRARVAARDPNGPWRDGSVYLYALDTLSDVILLHGAFPDRYELRPLVPIARDVVTGELILPQVIEAAKSNPEGGFLEYYFDDPADDTDRADIPKTGYARMFSGEVQYPDGTVERYEVIVGSGFYGQAP